MTGIKDVYPNKDAVKDRKLPIKFIKIETVIPVPLPVSDKIYDINLIDMNIRIHCRNQKRKVIPSLRDEIIPVAKWMENDRFGQISYMTSSFVITLNENKLIDDLIAQEVVQNYAQKCVDVINLIYTSYRVITGEHFPRSLALNDIVELTISFSQDGKNFHEEIYYLGIGGQTFTSFLSDDVSLIEINKVINKNISNLSLIIELFIDAEDFLREKNYRMAVIEIETAVEYMISRSLNKYYDTNLNDSNFKKVFFKELLNKRIDDKKFEVSGDDRKRLSKNKRPIFESRIIHNLSLLRKNGLIVNQKRANFKITKSGINKLKNL